ncbi:hypothetical protein [Mycobacteroides abscessus]|uniref:hypothetical protein n=1 Tax=Mycobacteroides abscessus TaxID=36809 RepID=UPI0021027293|nr:hypothetical protein [Mycobacteroides abscessus]
MTNINAVNNLGADGFPCWLVGLLFLGLDLATVPTDLLKGVMVVGAQRVDLTGVVEGVPAKLSSRVQETAVE